MAHPTDPRTLALRRFAEAVHAALGDYLADMAISHENGYPVDQAPLREAGNTAARLARELVVETWAAHEIPCCTCTGGGPAGLHASYCRTWDTKKGA